jgi:hypothetical protein
MLGACALLACGKTDGAASERARPVPVASVAPAASVPSPSPAPRGAALLPCVSLAATVDEDTASDIAAIRGDDPAAPRCTGVTLELTAKKREAGRVTLVATLVNGGTTPVTLVDPGDGSEMGWRSPLITWKLTGSDGKREPVFDGPRCGNMNTLHVKEIFTLKPRGRHVLGEWLHQPHPRPDRYVVSLVYENDPLRGLRGMADRGESAAALALIAKSTPCRVESNAITVDLSPY